MTRTLTDEVLETAVEMALALRTDEHARTLDGLRDAFPGESANDRFRERLLDTAKHIEVLVTARPDGWDGLDWPLVMDDAGLCLCDEILAAAVDGRDVDCAAIAARIVRRAEEAAQGDEAEPPFAR